MSIRRTRSTQYATGLNTDLLAATDAYRPGSGSGVRDILTSSPMLAAFDTMCQHIKSRHRHRDVIGVTCQYHGCSSQHGATPRYAREFKYCGKCKQVMYCSEHCHKSDWPSHKQHCTDIASLGLQKRELLRLPTALMETLSLVIMLQHWARAVLELDQDRHAGLKQRIIFTYTLAPRGSNGAQVLQLTHAELERTPHTLVCPGLVPLAQDTENVWIQLEFRADVPGMHTHYRTWMRISNYHLRLLPAEMASVMASPLKCLTGLNKEIRGDRKNCFGLRVIRE